MKLSLTIFLLFCAHLLMAQDKPQETKPGPSPERHREIRDSIRSLGRSRVTFKDEDSSSGKVKYQADRALLMPAMERSSVFRIGLPGWLMRLGLRAGREDFDTQEEYDATRAILKRIKGLRVAAFANNEAYDSKKLLSQYLRYVKRKKADPVLQVRAPGGGVQIHVKVRRGKVKHIMLLAYGAESDEDGGAAVIRLRSKLREKDLKKAIDLMTDSVEENAGVIIDTEPT